MQTSHTDSKRRYRRIALGAAGVILLVGLCVLLQYLIYPKVTELRTEGTGVLLRLSSPEEAQAVPVALEGALYHRLFRGKEDAVNGDVFVSGKSPLTGNGAYDPADPGFQTFFPTDPVISCWETRREGRIGLIDKSLSKAVFGWQEGGNTLLLVYPAKDAEAAAALLKEISPDQMKSWLKETGFDL